MKHILVGKQGEQTAKQFLKKSKFKIIETNHKNALGEIDIIAKEGKTLVFVEVKTRTSNLYGTPAMAITPHKKRKLTQAATLYLKQTGNLNCLARFDVLEVFEGSINHIKNAF